MIFLRGFIHCDPHPGNILVRKGSKGKAEIIMLDHGLYRVSINVNTCIFFNMAVFLLNIENSPKTKFCTRKCKPLPYQYESQMCPQISNFIPFTLLLLGADGRFSFELLSSLAGSTEQRQRGYSSPLPEAERRGEALPTPCLHDHCQGLGECRRGNHQHQQDQSRGTGYIWHCKYY